MPVIFIAILLAFLTVAAIWRYPVQRSRLLPPRNRPASETADADDQKADPLKSNFGRIVMAGLTGFVASDLLAKAMGIDNKETVSSSGATYICWFVGSFFAFLVGAATIRGLGEVLRCRLLSFRSKSKSKDNSQGKSEDVSTEPGKLRPQGRDRKSEPYRGSFLVFIDTFMNFAFGQNRLESAVLADVIVDHQQSLQKAIATIRQQIERTIAGHLQTRPRSDKTTNNASQEERPGPGWVRVGVSVMSPDGSLLTYIARAEESLSDTFSSETLGWLSVELGQPLWWRKSFVGKDVLIYITDKSSQEKKDVNISRFFKQRPGSSYEAFLMLPFPKAVRGEDSQRRGAIHVSLESEADLDGILEVPEAAPGNDAAHPFNGSAYILEAHEKRPLIHAAIRSQLAAARETLGILVQQFNENVIDADGKRLVAP